MKSLVVYDSFFGNTQKIAEIIAEEIGAESKKVQDVVKEDLQGLDLLVVGSPTRAFRPSPDITSFLYNLAESSLRGVKVSAFDTRIEVKDIKSPVARAFLGLMIKFFGYADKPIIKTLIKKGGEVLGETTGFCVLDSKGPLREAEAERAKEFAQSLRC
ncbi:MAG: Flavodoxin-1 [bacterium ADurb.Bin212]|nr:MAG: Flavodoxin-1 [bacterium ADurb.Bin212]